MQKKRKELSPDEAFARLATYCAYAEHSPHEVRTKCKAYGITGQDCDELIERLEREGYLNEERFARSFGISIDSMAGDLFVCKLNYVVTVSRLATLILLLQSWTRKSYKGKIPSSRFLSVSIAPFPRDFLLAKCTTD